jgi:hypothetical protein
MSHARASLVVLALSLVTASAATAAPTSSTLGDAAARVVEGFRRLERLLHIQQAEEQKVVGHGVGLSARAASLQIDLASGGERTVLLRDGAVLIDGKAAGSYVVGGPLDQAWRRLLTEAASVGEKRMLATVRRWSVAGLSGEDLAARDRIEEALHGLSAAAPAIGTATAPTAESGAGEAAGIPAPPAPGVPEPAAAAAPATAPSAAPSAVQILFRDVKNVVAMFVALAMVGFGAVFFARRYLEVVADTASESFGRSLVVGLLGQLLLLPTFAMMIVGLVFTIVGILLLPFAVLGFVLAACLAALGGYLAVAHAIGETVSRRRMANGAFVRSPNAYGYLFTGLVGLLGLWAAAALFGWAGPVVYVFRAAAFAVTWLAATVGFGAVLLSRAGLRDTFAGRHMGEQTGEYLWATPPATPAASRPGRRP